MALIKCSECGREISDKAAACIYCGCPISASQPKPAVSNGDKSVFNEFFGSNSSVQFDNKGLHIEFHAVLSGAENERSRQSVFVKELGRNVEFTVANTVKAGQYVRVNLQNEKYCFIQFLVKSVSRAPEIRQSAPAGIKPNQEITTTIKNYKPNLLVKFFKSRVIGKFIGISLAFVITGRFGDIDPDALFIIAGIVLLFMLVGSAYPIANIKKYYRKHHIDEAIRKDSGYMNVAISAYNNLPTKKMLAYIKELNPAAAQEIERQLAERKKK